MDIWCILSLGFSCSAVLHAGDGPVEVVYRPGDTLTVKLNFLHVPHGYNHYSVRTQYSDVPVLSGFLIHENIKFSLTLDNSKKHTVLETSLERPGSTYKLVRKLFKLTKSDSIFSRTRRCREISRTITVDWRSADRTSAEIFTAAGMQSTPRLVYFKDGDVLKFILKFMNLPRHDSLLANIFWGAGSSVYQLVENELRLNKTMDGSYLTLQMCFVTQDYNKTDTLTIIRLIYDKYRPHDSTCLGTPCEIGLDWENRYLSDIGRPAASVKANPPAAHKPRVTPERFVYDGRQFAVFTCHSDGSHRDLLSWYQLKGKKTSQLVMKQFSRDTSTTGMLLVLNKTLTASDQDSWIYCVRRTGVDSKPIFSDYIRLYFSTDTPNVSENVYITVQPAAEVATFHVNTNQSFECGGSQPVDGRSFNWYIEDVPYSNNFSHAPAEKMGSNSLTRKVNLTLDLNESYHLKRIYCVQEYHKTLESTNGYYYWNYGETARSHEILLSMVSEDTNSYMINGSNKTFPTFVIYIFLGVALIILPTVTALVILRRYRSINRTQEGNNESIYATAEITYAELQLSPESNNIVRKEEATPYAEIIGSCRPKADNR